jgi:3-(3-hydroxy-phenyl)propionate hydroxylase
MHESDAIDVIIAGLGPTGLVLAHLLGRAGHRVVVLEREPVFYGNARAVYTDDECMRIFQSIGMAEELQRDMLQECPVQFVHADGSVLVQYTPLQRPFGWPVVNFFYQPWLETTLTDALSRYPNVRVLRGRELVGLEQDEAGVSVTHQATREFRFGDADGRREQATQPADPQRLRARYLVGADGGRSTVRAQLGIGMSGRNFPEPWLVVDLQQKEGGTALRHLPYFNFVMDPAMPVVSCVQPGGFHRFEFMLMPGTSPEQIEHPDTVRALLSRYVDPDRFEIRRKLVYTFNALMAQRWRVGRVLLAGDAAHMTPQFMGQGASSGIRDAYNLGWKLDLVLRGRAGETLLDSYGAERHGHARAMIDVSVFMKNMVSMTQPLGTRLRDLALRTLQAIPPLRAWVQDEALKPPPRYADGSFVGLPRRRRNGPEGVLAPQPEVRLLDGRRLRFDAVLGEGFALVGLGCDPRAKLARESMAQLDALGTRYVALYAYGTRPNGFSGVAHDAVPGLEEVEDVDGRMVAWFRRAGFRRDAVAVLRPDRFAFAVVRCGQLDAALQELLRQLQVPATAPPAHGGAQPRTAVQAAPKSSSAAANDSR